MKVASDLGLGVDSCQVLRFPPPFTTSTSISRDYKYYFLHKQAC